MRIFNWTVFVLNVIAVILHLVVLFGTGDSSRIPWLIVNGAAAGGVWWVINVPKDETR